MKPQLILDELAEYVVRTKYDDFPKKVLSMAKQCLLDSIGCALGGTGTSVGTVFKNFLRSGFSEGSGSTVFGTPYSTSLWSASFINAEFSNALDLDDNSYGHPGSIIIPTALTFGEKVQATIKEALTAIILGYEISGRIGKAMSHDFAAKKVYGHVWQIFGAAAVAGKLHKLSESEMAMALAIAGATAPIPSDMKCSLNPNNKDLGMGMVKNNYGICSQGGIRAAVLAKLGYTGPRDLLEGDMGFWRMAGAKSCDFGLITAGLKSQYEILGVGFKPYPCSRHNHPAIDGALKIINNNKISLDEIEAVVVKVSPDQTLPPKDDQTPKTIGSAIYSIPYSVAVALFKVPILEWFDLKTINNPNILQLSQKITLRGELDEGNLLAHERSLFVPSEVIISVKGKKYCEFIRYPKGSPENPMTDDEQNGKFRTLASVVFNSAHIDKFLSSISNLKLHHGIQHLVNLLKAKSC